jgi:TRAP-type C4-dicarboxylate transport system substrate-binding protein
MTEHAITIRPICFSAKTFKKLPPDLQAAIRGQGGRIYGRQLSRARSASSTRWKKPASREFRSPTAPQ